jgi:hypothetical protein
LYLTKQLNKSIRTVILRHYPLFSSKRILSLYLSAPYNGY